MSSRRWWAAVVAAILTAGHAQAAATNVTWLGGGDVQNWFDPANWSNGLVPNNNSYQATIVTDTDVTFTNTEALLTINRITTLGEGKVTLSFGGIKFSAGTGYSPGGALLVGPGGMKMGAFTGGNTGTQLTTDGDFEATSLDWAETGTITQNGGKFNITTFKIHNSAQDPSRPRAFKNWQFRNSGNTTVTIKWVFAGEIVFHDTPTFEDGRPNWDVVCHNTITWWNLNGKQMYGNRVRIYSSHSDAVGHMGSISNAITGGSIDANTLEIGSSSQKRHFLTLANSTMTLRGAGTSYYNYSTNNTMFRITDNTVMVLDPAAGSANLHSGSDDRGADGVQPSDWEDNFAFDLIRVGSGDTITLVGLANRAGGTNAVYATRVEGLGVGGTIHLNNHNLYLKKAPRNMTFDTSLGGKVHVFERPAGALLQVR